MQAQEKSLKILKSLKWLTGLLLIELWTFSLSFSFFTYRLLHERSFSKLKASRAKKIHAPVLRQNFQKPTIVYLPFSPTLLPLGTNDMQSFNFTVLPFKIGGDSNYAAHRSMKFLLHTNYAFVMMLSASALLIERQCYNFSSVLFLQNIRGE